VTAIFTSTTLDTYQVENVNEYLRIVRFPVPNVPPRSFLFQFLHFNGLLKLLSRYSVVHGMSPDASFALSCQVKKMNKPFVSTIHGDPRISQKQFLRQPLSSWGLKEIGYYVIEFPLHDYAITKILDNSDHTVVCSKSALEDLKSYNNLKLAKTTVIFNGVDIPKIERAASESTNENEEHSIVFAGRLFWAKGVLHLLRAFKIIRETNPHVQLRIFGQGPLQKEVRKFVFQSDLEDSVKLFGHVSHRELLSEIQKADVVAFPSLQEAQSMFMLEAMAFKKPVVAFNLPFARELISHLNSGLLANPGDFRDLASKIQLLLSDEGLRLRLGNNAFNHVKTKHNWDTIVDAYLCVYRSICRNDKSND
jgi:glycosyltransferase involved in cell wall biosynthesis